MFQMILRKYEKTNIVEKKMSRKTKYIIGKKNNFVRRLCPPEPPGSDLGAISGFNTPGLNPPSQLVIVYHWLTFLNQVCKNLCPRNLKFRLTKNVKKIGKLFCIHFRTLRIFWDNTKIWPLLRA